ncbi:hypothetical protein Tco_0487701 [Tanacetum coccineum]
MNSFFIDGAFCRFNKGCVGGVICAINRVVTCLFSSHVEVTLALKAEIEAILFALSMVQGRTELFDIAIALMLSQTSVPEAHDLVKREKSGSNKGSV